ncbi:MAG: DNA primase [Anaerolineae bacterium]|nr:DNA primase [Anaerolineae bacterium]
MSVVDEVKERLDIVEVIQSYVPLKKAGRNYKGLCPFHAEKTPSFVVFPDSGTWHCFGACGTGGDVFTFVMKRENLDFGEALAMLARRAGVELTPRSPQAAEADQRLDLLREINQATALYYHHLLLNSAGAARALSYMEGRGFSRDTLERFQVGYAPERWDGLLRYLTGKGYAAADLAEAGVISERDDGSGYHDRFRRRIIFPIRDQQGRTIGFGGRILSEGTPKYLNSPQTPLFDKSSVLYGLDLARQGIRAAGAAVIVEGYTDVLMAHQYGLNNVVAQMGTALTEQQLKLLKRLTSRFVLALDPDAAGDQATLRGLDVARQVMDRDVVPVRTANELIRFGDRLAADIQIVALPAGLDPDEVIRDDPAEWARLVAEAQPIMDYYLQALTAGLDLTTAEGKREAVQRLDPLLTELGDWTLRMHYVQQLARMIQVDDRVLWEQIRRGAAGRKAQPRPAQPEARAKTAERRALGVDEHCLASLLAHPHLFAAVDEALRSGGEAGVEAEDLGQTQDRAIFAAWRGWLEGGGAPDARAGFCDTLDGRLQERAGYLLDALARQPEVPDDLVRDTVTGDVIRLRLQNLRRKIGEMRFLQQDAQATGDRQGAMAYGGLIREMHTRIGRLEKVVDERTMMGRRRREDAAVRVFTPGE